MIPTDVFAQTPTTPQRDRFCLCCSITSDAFNKIFYSEPSSEVKLSSSESPRETIVSLQTNSFDVNGLHPYHEGIYPPDATLASASNDNYYSDDQDLYSKSQDHEYHEDTIIYNDRDGYLNRNQITSSSMSSTNLQNISYTKIDEPVVFAEMNQMLTRVGIKLERSAPPSRRGSPPRALTPCMGMGSSSRVSSPKSPGSFRKSYSSEVHQCGGHVSSNFSVVSSARSISEDILVSLEGDAHLRRLQQACKQQMQENSSFSRRGSSEKEVASYFDDSITLTPPPSNGRSHILLDRKDFILRALDSSRELDDDAKKAGEEHLSSHSIDRTHSNGSPSTSLFSSDLVYSTSSTSQASSFSSSCISPISHSSSSSMPPSAVCSARDGKIFNVSIAYSEVLQLQGNAAEAVTVVEDLLKTLNLDPMKTLTLKPECNSLEKSGIKMRSTLGTITLRSGTSSTAGSEKSSTRPPSPRFSRGGGICPETSTVPHSSVIRSLTSTDHSIDRDLAQHKTQVALCHRRLGVLYKVLGRLPEAEKSLESYISLRKELDPIDGISFELDGRTDIANAYCLLATIVDQMAGRADDALEYDRLAVELMSQSK